MGKYYIYIYKNHMLLKQIKIQVAHNSLCSLVIKVFLLMVLEEVL